MKYLCLICAENVMETMTPSSAEQHYKDYAAFIGEIRRDGHYVSANRLKPANTAITVRVREGKTTVTDGPFAETKEQLGGYFLIDARDQSEAVQIASRIPGAAIGCVEVRPVADDPRTRALGLDDNNCQKQINQGETSNVNRP